MRSSFRLRRDPHHSTPHNISGEKKSPHHEALAKFTRRGSRRRRAASGCTIRSVGVHGEEYDEETTKNTPDRWRWGSSERLTFHEVSRCMDFAGRNGCQNNDVSSPSTKRVDLR
ncbi:uncharacterized protein LOC125500663 isoform X2 [Athalia rosae]|uniref:uncharacterized protein LOC125500663 isoform X2 n=1 Tax=Athalia rosae TaxID=37344 RepID=UPI0020343791|nr:uncharacterized protein LOC125500663 isoform X2 [Athalia rosae]